eukprot:TRINITY_DN27103_c0_g1_i1.p1 TRINITY_DN27103_c0_g1~~TRINITY_DN27103_c0_g1_i1.p1  ORF type:complete len:357 (+),score=56.55 TRINITY_DN27103_c0_g1_i1:64-1071(+)
MDPAVRAFLSFAFLFAIWWWYGLPLTIALGYAGKTTGAMSFFPLLYRIYTSELFGYKIARVVMHPRQDRPHSKAFQHDGEGISVLPVPVLMDNYSYIVWCTRTMQAVAIDPADPNAVYAAADRLNVKLTHIIATHKHWDHSGGNAELKDLVKLKTGVDIEIVGSAIDHPHGLTFPVTEETQMKVGYMEFRFKMVPGHTKGHILTLCKAEGAVTETCFTGDSLFCCGVGAFFECDTVEELLLTYNTYHCLPDETVLFPGHEYSEMLATQVHRCCPGNADIRLAYQIYRQARATKTATVPTSVGKEKRVNCFLRIAKHMMEAAKTPDDIQNLMYARQ